MLVELFFYMWPLWILVFLIIPLLAIVNHFRLSSVKKELAALKEKVAKLSLTKISTAELESAVKPQTRTETPLPSNCALLENAALIKKEVTKETTAAPTVAAIHSESDVVVTSKPVTTFSNKPSTSTSTTAAIATVRKSPQPKPQKKAKESHTENDLLKKFWEWCIKGNPVAKLAIIILFFGLSYLLKYSIDRDLISPGIRILSSLCIGVALLVLGWKLRHKKALYALILQGGAIGTLYITIFASIKLYEMIPMLMAFGLLVIICASSVMFAVLQRAICLAIIACIGGYLAPILLSTNEGNHIALFSYYLLISSAIVAISISQSWHVLNLIGFAFTFIVAVGWGVKSYQPEFYLECQLFIIANTLIYGVLAVVLSIRSLKKEQYQNMIDLILFLGVPLLGFGLQYNMTKNWEFGPAFSSLGYGLVYLIGSYLILRKWASLGRGLALYGLAIGIGFATLAIPLATDAHWTSLAWLVEGFALSWAALTQRQYRFAWGGALITLLGSFAVIFSYTNYYSYYINNSSIITLYGVLSAILLISGCLWHHYRDVHKSSDILKRLFVTLAALAWCIWIVISINRLDFTNYEHLPIMFCFVIAVWIWFFIGKKQNWDMLQYAVIALWPVMVFAVFTNYIWYQHTYPAGIWGLSWLAAFVSAYSYLHFVHPQLNQPKYIGAILHVSLLWIVISWLVNEVLWATSYLPWGYAVLDWSIMLAIMSAIVFVIYVIKTRRYEPLLSYFKEYWLIGLAPVALYITLALFIGLRSNGQILNWQYLPFLNPLEQSAIFALMALTLWFVQSIKLIKQSQATPEAVRLLSKISYGLLFLLVFLWGNSILLRTLAMIFDLSWSWSQLWRSSVIQMTVSLTWTIIALIFIIIANKNKIRGLWFISASLLAIVVVKLGLIDSVKLDGLYRASAFIGVAILMLIIGYLAPIPPKLKNQ